MRRFAKLTRSVAPHNIQRLRTRLIAPLWLRMRPFGSERELRRELSFQRGSHLVDEGLGHLEHLPDLLVGQQGGSDHVAQSVPQP